MSVKKLLLLLLLSNMVWACTLIDRGGLAQPPTETIQAGDSAPGTGENKMETEGTYAGPIPDQIDVRLQRRDTRPLPAEALLRFQVINRGKNPQYNYRWLLYEDGRWFLAWHSGDTSDWQTPFDTELPETPTQQLPAKVVNQVKEQLKKADFLAQPPYQADRSVEDGTFFVVTARVDDQVHEVIYEAISPSLIEFLEKFAAAEEISEAGMLKTLLGKLTSWL